MKRKIIFFYLFIILYPINTIEIRIDNPNIFLKIIKGKDNGKIGLEKPFAGGGTGLSYMKIDPYDNIYIIDGKNNRIIIIDKNGKFINNINNKGKFKLGLVKKIEFDNNSNLIILTIYGLMKIDKEGNEIFHVERKDLDEEVIGNRNFFVINNDILLYDKKYNSKILDEKGKEKSENNKNSLIKSMNSKSLSLHKNIDIKNNINQFLKEKKLNVNNKKLLSTDFYYHKKYNHLIKGENINDHNSKLEIDNLDFNNYELIGYDKNDNVYWEAYTKDDKSIILIINSNGNILDCFFTNIIEGIYAIDSTGNVYCITPDDNYENAIIWKFERKW